MTLAYIGKWGEREACRYLKKQGYYIEKVNVRNKVSELDIVGFKKGELIFVEVKTRHIKNAMLYPIFETINDNKISHIERGIRIYISENYAILKRRRIKTIRSDFIFIHYKNSFLGFPRKVEIIWKKSDMENEFS